MDVETLTGRYGREIFARVQHPGAVPLTPAWWDEQLMDWTMSDEAVKVQLFRFVDALPTLRSGADVTRHLREYFAEARGHVPPWLTWGLRVLPTSGLLARFLAWLARFSARRLARTFIAGTNHREALRAIAAMRRRNLAFTVDLLGEATITEQEADQSQAEYLELINGLSQEVNAWPANERIDADAAGPVPRVNVSVKLSALDSQFDPIDPEGTGAAVAGRLRPLLRAARQQRAFINFDMEQYAYKDLTLRIFRDILTEPEFRDWADVGIAIQAYLRDTAHDLAELRQWAEWRGTPGVGPAGQGRLLGLRNDHGPAAGLAHARLVAQVGDRRRVREGDALPAREPALAPAGLRQPQYPQPGACAGRGPGAGFAAERASRSRCFTAWPIPSRTPWSASASVCVSIRPMASSCPEWLTWYAGCWKTPPTSRSCAPASGRTCR